MQSDDQTENEAGSGSTHVGADGSAVPPPIADAGPTKDVRERSTIDFPYLNLEEAEEGAKELFQAAGTAEVSHAQAASAMGQSATSSAFRVRLSAMRLFGLIEAEGGRVRLSGLGRSIADSHSVLGARVEAFMRVPLYQQVVTNHEGRALPGTKALEVEFIQLGVAKKQAERARQVFDRSARHAGFLKPGTDRFVTPITQGKRQDPPAGEHGASDTPATPKAADRQQGGVAGSGVGNADMDPVVSALVQKLPPPGAPWTADEQVVWLRMMSMAFTMTYGGKRSIRIEVEPEGILRP